MGVGVDMACAGLGLRFLTFVEVTQESPSTNALLILWSLGMFLTGVPSGRMVMGLWT